MGKHATIEAQGDETGGKPLGSQHHADASLHLARSLRDRLASWLVEAEQRFATTAPGSRHPADLAAWERQLGVYESLCQIGPEAESDGGRDRLQGSRGHSI